MHGTSPYPTPAQSPPEDAASPVAIESPVTVLVSSRAVISGHITSATIVVSQTTEKVTSVFYSVLPPSDFPPGTPYVDHSPYILLPGLVDAHVHLNEPGRTEWEGFYTGTQAAAFGGVTTVIDMPLNAIPPTTTVAALEEKVEAARGKCWVDVGFYGGIIPTNTGELKALVRQGVRGFKGFLIESGVDEFPAVSADDVAKVLVELADEPTTVMFHAEMIPPITDSVGDGVQTSQPPLHPFGALDVYSTFLSSRPASFETHAIEMVVSLAHLAPSLPLHIVHLSAVEAIPVLREARSRGIKITAETCPHYLSLAAEQIKDGDTRHKCCPPIRSQSNQDSLWQELRRHAGEGVIKTVVSDHSPCTPQLKLLPSHIPPGHDSQQQDLEAEERGNFFSAWGGISSVGLGLPILWTEMTRRGLTTTTTKPPSPSSSSSSSSPPFSSFSSSSDSALTALVQWCCTNTAKQVGLDTQKGDLAVGFDADVCVFDDAADWVVEPSSMLFRNKCSPYQGKWMKGVVRETWLRGQRVFVRGAEGGGFGGGAVKLGGSYGRGRDGIHRGGGDGGGGGGGCIGRLLLEPRGKGV